MAKIDKEDAVMIAQELAKALKGGPFGGAPTGGGGGGGGGGGSGLIGMATGAVGKAFGDVVTSSKALGGSLIDVSGKLITGGGKISDVTSVLSKEFSSAAYQGGLITKGFASATKAIDGLVKYVEDGVGAFRELSKTGASFNNSIIELRGNAANTRLTLAEYGEVVKNNSGLLTTFGGTVNQGAKRFTELSKAFFDSSVADDLLLMGYNTKDLNELLALQTTTMRLNQKLEGEALKREVDAAARLALEMDAMAKLTGQSRKEQEDKLRKDRENGQIMAAIDAEIAAGGGEVQKAFDAMTTAAARGGKDFQRMQQEIFAMGRPSQEMAAKFSMIGGEAQKKMMEAAEATKKGDVERAKRLTAEAAAAAAAQSQSETMRGLARQGVKDAADLTIQTRKYEAQLQEIAKTSGLNLDVEKDRIKAGEMLDEQLKKEQEASKDNVTKTAILAEQRLADTYAAVNNALVKPLAENVNPLLQGTADKLKSFNDGIGARAKLEEQISDVLKKSLVKIDEAIAKVEDRRTPGPGPTPTAPLTPQQQQGAGQAGSAGSDYRRRREEAGAPRPTIPGEAPPQRNLGSFGTVGKLFENWGSGTLVELHGMEGVMRPEDIEKIVETSLSAVKTSMNQVPKSSGMPSFDLGKITRDISTSFSAAKTSTPAPTVVTTPPAAETAATPAAPVVDTEFGDLDGAMAKVAEDAEKSMSSFNLGGLFSKLKNKVSNFFKPKQTEIQTASQDINDEFGDLAGAMKAAAERMYPDTEFGDLEGAMAKVAQDVDTEFGDLAGAMKAAAERMYPDTEFGDLEGAMAKVAQDIDTEFGDLEGAMRAAAERMYPDTEFGDLDGAIAKVSEDIDTEFGDLAGAMKAAAERMYPDTEFGDLEAAMAQVAQDIDTEFGDLESAMAKVAADVDTEFGDLAGAMKRVADDMYPDTEFGDLEAAMAKAAQDVDTEFGDLAGAMKAAAERMYPDDEFGDLEGAMAKVAQDVNGSFGSVDDSEMGGFATQPANFGSVDDSEMGGFATEAAMKPSTPSIDLNALNLPGINFGIKSAAATVAPAVNRPVTDSDTARENARMQRQAEANKKSEESKPATAPAQGKVATLDDVVKELAMLNTKIAALTEETKQIGSKQERATRSNNQNIYSR